MTRTANFERRTNETDVRVTVDVDGSGRSAIRTGIGFLDHLLTTFARFARIDVDLECTGDLHVDDHHTAEDCALALGTALDRALGTRAGIARFGHAYAPLDEALARARLHPSGRAAHRIELGLTRDALGGLACENVRHVLQSLAVAMRMALHVDLLHGENDHHRAEAAFKATALALRAALRRDGDEATVPSTKGVL
jgi:imidazoleglycerol-phosphate dehydratase